MTIREFTESDILPALEIWNEIIREGNAFPAIDELTAEEGVRYFKSQSFTGVGLDDDGNMVAVYILHPNNEGHCGHICNASYAVKGSCRGQHLGEHVVRHCMQKGRELGFEILQFNAVVASNERALRLYRRLGFTQLGVIPRGFKKSDGTYEDIIPHYHPL